MQVDNITVRNIKMIRKVRRGWKVISHRTGRSFGTYPSRRKAIQRLKQIKFFGKKKR